MAASPFATAARARLAARAAAALAAVVAAAPAGCGGGPEPERGDGAEGPPAAGRQGQAPSPYVPPPGTPAQGTGPADPARVRVIRTWVRELRDGDVAGAARTFADGALVQNGTPVVRLRSFAERRLFIDQAFPCGARVADARGAPRGFTVVRFTLTPRVGGSCPGPGGGSAAAAIRVRGGRITEWYRLPDPAGPEQPPDAEAPPAPAGPPV